MDALVANDVLASARLDNATSVANLKTLFVLHNEAAHLIARGDVKKFKKIIVDDATFVFSKWNIKKFYKTSKVFCLDETMYYLIG